MPFGSTPADVRTTAVRIVCTGTNNQKEAAPEAEKQPRTNQHYPPSLVRMNSGLTRHQTIFIH